VQLLQTRCCDDQRVAGLLGPLLAPRLNSHRLSSLGAPSASPCDGPACGMSSSRSSESWPARIAASASAAEARAVTCAALMSMARCSISRAARPEESSAGVASSEVWWPSAAMRLRSSSRDLGAGAALYLCRPHAVGLPLSCWRRLQQAEQAEWMHGRAAEAERGALQFEQAMCAAQPPLGRQHSAHRCRGHALTAASFRHLGLLHAPCMLHRATTLR